VDEVNGLLHALDAAIEAKAENGELSTMYYVGAYTALEIVFEQEHIEYPDDFVRLFDMRINEIEKEHRG
jgi:hypothetical protein